MFGFVKKWFSKSTPEDLFEAECDYRFMKANAVCVVAVCKLNDKQELTDEEYDNIDTVIVSFTRFVRKHKDNQMVLERLNNPQMSDGRGQLWFTKMINIMVDNPTKFPKFNLLLKNDRINEMTKAIAKDFD